MSVQSVRSTLPGAVDRFGVVCTQNWAVLMTASSFTRYVNTLAGSCLSDITYDKNLGTFGNLKYFHL